ncbi:MAG: hypothetical protein MJ200_01575 [Mycoplasmoidaceae bacterium]|nr:hypothetical protein [Mycoplasmoidaceae bacterium]
MGLFSRPKVKAEATRTYKCPKCGFTRTKQGGGLIGGIAMNVAPKCPKCKCKMELVGSSD